MKKILLGLSDPLLKELDDLAKKEEITRSEAIRNTLKYGLSVKLKYAPI